MVTLGGLGRDRRRPLQDRSSRAKHPFRTMKRPWDQGHLLTRKLPIVRAEIVLAYDIKRGIKILGAQRMIEALA